MTRDRIDPLNPGMIAHEIARLTEMLEVRTDQYAEDIGQAAEAEAAFKGEFARVMLDVIDGSSSRMTVAEREARVEVRVNNTRILAEIAGARSKATREALNSLRVQIDALRSLGANVRAQT